MCPAHLFLGDSGQKPVDKCNRDSCVNSEVWWSDSLQLPAVLYSVAIPMREMTNKSAAILLFAIAIFSVGPQLGSLDINGDGVPDVPVMVMNGSGGRNVELARIDEQAADLEIASLFSELTCSDSGLVEHINAANLRITGLDSLTPLRC